MKLSSRSRYGFRAILELAVEYGNGPVRIKTIAEREDISNKYLEQLMAMLKSTDLIRSVRGPRGGYVLSKAPNQIKLKEVFIALDREELKKLLKEKGVKSLDDFNAFMREGSKEVVETILDGELTDGPHP